MLAGRTGSTGRIGSPAGHIGSPGRIGPSIGYIGSILKITFQLSYFSNTSCFFLHSSHYLVASKLLSQRNWSIWSTLQPVYIKVLNMFISVICVCVFLIANLKKPNLPRIYRNPFIDFNTIIHNLELLLWNKHNQLLVLHYF